MKVSLEWLNEYVNTDGLDAAQLAEDLTNAGLEVEGVESTGAQFSGVIVAKVLKVEPHPNADKLRLGTVDIGGATPTVVCGAPNLREGITIAYAQVGAKVISRKDGTLFELTPAKIRGVESCGMICSIDELGLNEQFSCEEDGIWPLDTVLKSPQLGQPLEVALGLKTDAVLETAPTANRGDHMAMIGIAREVAALHNRPVTLPPVTETASVPECHGFTVKLEDASVCEYYGGAIMTGLTVGPSPEWLVKRLEAAGVRSHNAVVDITNYVMLETGQPLHAFDADRLKPGLIGVRKANEGETLKTLDAETRTLTGDSVVITCNDVPVALAGVMGGEATEIGDNSKTLFLEAAYFPPASNRRSAKSVGLRTDASARFERGVDKAACRSAMFRAVQLYTELCDAKLEGVIESPPITAPVVEVPLRLARMEKLLGAAIEETTTHNILEKLGFGVKPGRETGTLIVSVPSYRQHDVSREVDLIEEVIRVHGYHNVSYTLPKKTRAAQASFRQETLAKVRRCMAGAGLQEVVTNSLIGESLLEKTGFTLDRDKLASVLNSHSRDHTMMRQSLLPNLLEVGKFNLAQGNSDVWIFETGRTYFKLGKPSDKNSGVVEKLCLSGLMTGNGFEGNWHVPKETQPVDFYQMKGVVEALMNALGLDGVVTYVADTSQPTMHPGKTAKLLLAKGNKPLGILGQLHPQFEEKLKLRQPVYLFELDLEALLKACKQQAGLAAENVDVSPYPAVKRDMAFAAPISLSHAEICTVVEGLADPLITRIELFDEYRGEQVGEGNRSLAYRLTLQSKDETLTDAVIDASVARVKQALSEKLSVSFR